MWTDPWLREAENFKLETSRPYSLAILKIQDLWIPNHKEWDVELLGEIFTERDANAIASIPLNLYNPVDELIRHFDKLDQYTVKSSYYVARSYDYPLSMKQFRIYGIHCGNFLFLKK